MKIYRKAGVATSVMTLAIAAVTIGMGAPAQAAFTDCSAGTYLNAGRTCLWAGSNYSSTKRSYAGGGYTGGFLMRSYGNRISNRSAWVYDYTTSLIVYMPHDTGNQGSTQYDAYEVAIGIG